MTIERKSKVKLFPKLTRIWTITFAALLIITGYRGFEIFGYIFTPNVLQTKNIYISPNEDYESLENRLVNEKLIKNKKAFRWVSKKKELKENIKPGHFTLIKGTNTNTLVNMLKAGNQTPVEITFNAVRFKSELAGKLGKQLLADSIEIIKLINDPDVAAQFGFNENTFQAMFIPNTYEVYWTISPMDFFKRMKKEYDNFWNDTRKHKASRNGLSPLEVSIIASITQEETNKIDEMGTIAGVYVNRLKRNMLLQADPTIKFALGDYSIKRVLDKHLEINSPYNTYKNIGLPPGPINFPEIKTLEAVLSHENHNYLYFCAKEDFSGYHVFARTLREHNRNARNYQRALNKNKIYR